MSRAAPDTRERLIDAARHLFWAQGYAATGLSEILGRAPANSGSFYPFVESKDALLRTVLDTYLDAVEPRVLAPVRARARRRGAPKNAPAVAGHYLAQGNAQLLTQLRERLASATSCPSNIRSGGSRPSARCSAASPAGWPRLAPGASELRPAMARSLAVCPGARQPRFDCARRLVDIERRGHRRRHGGQRRHRRRAATPARNEVSGQ